MPFRRSEGITPNPNSADRFRELKSKRVIHPAGVSSPSSTNVQCSLRSSRGTALPATTGRHVRSSIRSLAQSRLKTSTSLSCVDRSAMTAPTNDNHAVTSTPAPTRIPAPTSTIPAATNCPPARQRSKSPSCQSGIEKGLPQPHADARGMRLLANVDACRGRSANLVHHRIRLGAHRH
jgi:hypothetical protein